MKSKHTLLSKLLSFVLALTVLLGVMPIMSLSADEDSTSIADPKTIDNWQYWFSKESSRYAGGIFIDKSVYTAKEAVAPNSYFYDIANKLKFGKDNFGNDNFMVSLSAVGSTTQITGKTSVPADTVFILDLSASMSNDEVTTMIRATNRAITELLENPDSRVSVVLYSGNSTTSNNATLNNATVILPLNRYTTTISITETDWVNVDGDWQRQELTYDSFLSYTNSSVSVSARYSGNGNNRRQTGGVKVEGEQDYVSGSKAKNGGTYTQAGLWKAYGQFPMGDETKTASGTQRKPIVVLMTDGAPTIATTNYNNIANSNVGDGRNTNAETSFLVQMTAAWVKANLKIKYNGVDPLFYTLGLGVGNDSNAVGVLNPAAAANPSAEYWTDFSTDGKVSNISFSSAASGATGTGPISGDQSIILRNYVDKYYSAADADELSQMFDSIVEDIGSKLKNYPTLIESGNPTQDGYISFTDEIGRYMEVKNVKGIHIGEGSLVTGGMFSQYLTEGKIGNVTTGQLTELGVTLIDALKSRFDISESQALQLLNSAINNNYIYFNNANDFSNYVVWYADEDNNFIAPYSRAITTAPQNAKYKVKSYLYLGSVSDESGTDTDMLYILIRVREDLETGIQIVDANLPASLLPLVIYTIELNGTSLTDSTVKSMTNNIDDIHPACLLFEVGLKDTINRYNIDEIVKNYPKNADGTYHFYTNRWKSDNNVAFTVPNEANLPSGIYEHGLIGSTEAHFHPALTNRRYYYTEDTTVYYKDGEDYKVYNGNTNPSGDGYYHIYSWVVTENNTTKVESIYNPILTDALSKAQKTANGWIIPANTPKRYFGEVAVNPHENHTDKTANTTETLGWSVHPASSYETSGTAQGYHIFSYLGNNGRITVSPTQGIRLSKTIAENVDNAPTQFKFNITLSVDGTFDYRLIKADGTYTDGTCSTNNKVLSVTLSDGETVYIADIPANTTYTVEEEYTAEYVGNSTNQTGTISAGKFELVDFVNSPRGAGSLRVSKDVTHPFQTTAIPDALLNEEFNVTVAFTGETTALAKITATDGTNAITSNDGGKTFSFKLKDNGDVLFSNIAEGVTYKVEENIAASQVGYTLDTLKTSGLEGSILKDTQSHAHIVNKYEFSKVKDFEIKVSGTKTVIGTNSLAWNNETFQIALYMIDLASGNHNQIGAIQTVSKSNTNYKFVIDENILDLDKIGTYHFHIVEIIPDTPVPNMAYDESVGGFNVTVDDSDADGYLEITSVTSPVGNTVTDASDNNINTYNVVKNFENVFNSANVHIPVEKRIVDGAGNPVTSISKVGFVFGLYDGNTLLHTAATNENGIATFAVPISKGEEFSYTIKEIVPNIETAIVGMTYNTTTSYTANIKWDNSKTEPEYSVANVNGTPVITNTYNSNMTTPEITLSGIKTLNGGNLRNGDTFSFELYETDADFNLSGHSVLQTKSVNATNNSITFSSLSFSTTGTKYLVIREKNGGEVIDGVSYDVTEYHIIVEVIKEFNGDSVVLKNDKVIVHKSGAANVETDEINFNNTYTISDVEQVILKGKKSITGRTLIANGFEFGLFDEQGGLIEKVKNAADGTFAFSQLHFNAIGTYTYKIKEIIPNNAVNGILDGVTYDDTEYTVTITLTDDQKGGLNKSVKVNNSDYNDSVITFVNEYNAKSTSISFTGTKTLLGRDFKDTDRFYFELYSADESFAITSTTPLKTATADVKQSGNKSEFEINVEYEINNIGTHRYVLLEKIPTTNKMGIGYDANEYHITVLAIDNGKGSIVANVQSIVHTGDDTHPKADSLNFTNIYKPAAASHIIPAKKVLEGKALTADEFIFELYEADNSGNKTNLLATAKNDVNGDIDFNYELLFEKEGTYKYVIIEKNTGTANVIFDDSVFVATIEVKDDTNGELYIYEITYTKNGDQVQGVEFTNTYKEPDPIPEPPVQPEIPQTGDKTHLNLWLALYFISGGGLLGLFFLKKRAKGK